MRCLFCQSTVLTIQKEKAVKCRDFPKAANVCCFLPRGAIERDGRKSLYSLIW